MDASISAPAATVPPGQQQDLANPPSQAYLMILAVAVCLGFATPMVWIRLYVSLSVIKQFRWTDAFISLSWLGFVAYSITALTSIKYGSLTDIWNTAMADHVKWAHILHVEELTYTVLVLFAKTSVLLLYKRIFVSASCKRKWIRYAILATVVFNALLYAAETFIVAFSCHPRRKIWDPRTPGTCVNMSAVFVGTAVLNIVSGVLIIMIPMTVIWKLRIPCNRKIEISLILGFGVLGLLSSTARLVYGILHAHDPNQTIAVCKTMLWTFGEITAYLLISCVPTLPLPQHTQTAPPTTTSNPHLPPRHSWLIATSPDGCPQIGALCKTWDDESEIEDEDLFFWRDVDGSVWSDGSSVTTFATGVVVRSVVEVASVPKVKAQVGVLVPVSGREPSVVGSRS